MPEKQNLKTHLKELENRKINHLNFKNKLVDVVESDVRDLGEGIKNRMDRIGDLRKKANEYFNDPDMRELIDNSELSRLIDVLQQIIDNLLEAQSQYNWQIEFLQLVSDKVTEVLEGMKDVSEEKIKAEQERENINKLSKVFENMHEREEKRREKDWERMMNMTGSDNGLGNRLRNLEKQIENLTGSSIKSSYGDEEYVGELKDALETYKSKVQNIEKEKEESLSESEISVGEKPKEETRKKEEKEELGISLDDIEEGKELDELTEKEKKFLVKYLKKKFEEAQDSGKIISSVSVGLKRNKKIPKELVDEVYNEVKEDVHETGITET